MPKILNPLRTEELELTSDDESKTSLIAEAYDYPTNHVEINLTAKLMDFGVTEAQINSPLENEKLQQIVDFIYKNTGIIANVVSK